MSGPVPSPSMNGTIGLFGTLSLPLAMVILAPPAGAVRVGSAMSAPSVGRRARPAILVRTRIVAPLRRRALGRRMLAALTLRTPMAADTAAAPKALYANLNRVILGKGETILLLIAALIARGHVLLEDVPGTGKTMLARTLAQSLHATLRRLQCTPDLLPSDVTGHAIYRQDLQQFQFVPGPAFSDVLLVDEINRATPRTQACLLECMEERQVTVDNETHKLADGFFVIATQNPAGYHGTFPLPEAQLDRFMLRLRLGYPSLEHETALLAARVHAEPLSDIAPVLTPAGLAELQAAVRAVEVHPDVQRYIAAVV